MGFDQMHIRHRILYEFKKGSKASQAARNIRSVYKNEVPSIRTCQRWFKQFESGNFNLEDSLRSGRPSSVPLKVLKAVVEENPKKLPGNWLSSSVLLTGLGKVSKLSLRPFQAYLAVL